ncbi:hypothetical protein [Sphingomonas sp. BAUL-RG-20F-R05-02]|uniref:hypothetical protein n=1 Tax=Sphingomonas sp. BAUL-RG-20F-R05-02 TaxID=2914830 RepID=UPI001F5827DB|nr:hypothetical protein [Sphingomonas sp. BAUL-RG-20F-R05-02]
MADEAKLHRERADAERAIAAGSTLPMCRALHCAARACCLFILDSTNSRLKPLLQRTMKLE